MIGIGPRCTYDLKAMLPFPDVRCVAIADVQAKRREAGKKLVDEHYGNKDCVLYRDFRELLDRKDIDAVLIATGDRWHAPASILAAKAGKDVYSEKPCGITIAACQELADTMHHREARLPGRHPAPQRAQFPEGGRAGPLAASSASSTRCTPRCTRPCSTTPGCRPSRNPPATWWTGTSGSARRRGVLQPAYSTAAGAGSGTSTPAPGCSTGAPTRSICASGPTRPTTRCPSSTSRRRRTSSAAMPTA